MAGKKKVSKHVCNFREINKFGNPAYQCGCGKYIIPERATPPYFIGENNYISGGTLEGVFEVLEDLQRRHDEIIKYLHHIRKQLPTGKKG